MDYLNKSKKKYYEKDYKFDNLIHSSSSNKINNFKVSDYPINTFLSTQASVSNTTQKMSSKNLISSYKVDKYSNKLLHNKNVQSSKNVSSYVSSLNTLPGVIIY